jgi:hypothetical protein
MKRRVWVWEQPPTVWIRGAEEYEKRVYAAIYTVCLRRAPEIQNWMRRYARWKDRTGNARQGLHTQVFATKEEIAVEMAHGVFYGMFLELRYSGKYAIINKTLDRWGKTIWKEVVEIMQS